MSHGLHFLLIDTNERTNKGYLLKEGWSLFHP